MNGSARTINRSTTQKHYFSVSSSRFYLRFVHFQFKGTSHTYSIILDDEQQNRKYINFIRTIVHDTNKEKKTHTRYICVYFAWLFLIRINFRCGSEMGLDYLWARVVAINRVCCLNKSYFNRAFYCHWIRRLKWSFFNYIFSSLLRRFRWQNGSSQFK